MNQYRGNSSDSSSDSNSSEDENCHLKVLKKKKNTKVSDRPTVDTPAFTAQQSDWLKGDFKLLQETLAEKPAPTDSGSSLPTLTDKPKRKKNNIWSNVLTEQVLSDDITHSFGLKKLDGDRSVENYDYRAAQALLASQREGEEEGVEQEEGELIEEEEELEEGEMKEETQFDKNRLSRKRTYQSREHNHHKPKIVIQAEPGEPLELPPITDTMSALTDRELANVIAENMNEQKPELVQRVMEVLGRERTTEAYEKTVKIEAEGGSMIANQRRRRTSGGIFIQIIKCGLTKEQISVIFPVDEEQALWKKRKRAHTRRKNKEALPSVTSTAVKGDMEDYSSDARRLMGTKCPGSTPVTSPLVSPAVSPVPSPSVSPTNEDLPDTSTNHKQEISDSSVTKTEAEVTSSSQEEMDVA